MLNEDHAQILCQNNNHNFHTKIEYSAINFSKRLKWIWLKLKLNIAKDELI